MWDETILPTVKHRQLSSNNSTRYQRWILVPWQLQRRETGCQAPTCTTGASRLPFLPRALFYRVFPDVLTGLRYSQNKKWLSDCPVACIELSLLRSKVREMLLRELLPYTCCSMFSTTKIKLKSEDVQLFDPKTTAVIPFTKRLCLRTRLYGVHVILISKVNSRMCNNSV